MNPAISSLSNLLVLTTHLNLIRNASSWNERKLALNSLPMVETVNLSRMPTAMQTEYTTQKRFVLSICYNNSHYQPEVDYIAALLGITPRKVSTESTTPPKEQLDAINQRIREIESSIQSLEAQIRAEPFRAIQLGQEIQRLRSMIQPLSIQTTGLPPPPPPPETRYELGTEVLLQSSNMFWGNVIEEWSLLEGFATFATATSDRSKGLNCKIVQSDTAGNPGTEWYIVVDVKRNDATPRDGSAFGRYGLMYLVSGKSHNLFYMNHWAIDAKAFADRNKSSTWFIEDINGNVQSHPKTGQPVRFRNKATGQYLTIDGERITTTSSSREWIINTSAHQEPILPEQDLARRIGDEQNKNCHFTRDANLVEVMVCTTKETVVETGATTVDEIIKNIPPLPLPDIPWVLIGGIVLFLIFKK